MTQCHRDLQAILVWHEQVRDHEGGGSLSELAKSYPTIGRLDDYVPSLFQHLPKEDTDLLVVINDENGGMAHRGVFQDAVTA